MKNTFLTGSCIIIGCLLIIYGCKKEEAPRMGSVATINVINAIPNSANGILPIFGTVDSPLYYQDLYYTIYYGSGYCYTQEAGKQNLTIIQANDTPTAKFAPNLYKGSLQLASGGIYSMFLGGDTSNVDTLFTADRLPGIIPTDSVSGIRFANMSTGSNPYNVTLTGNPPSQTEFANISYKSASSFKTYPTNSAIGGVYNFTIWDQVTGDSVTTFTWAYKIGYCHTIVISGSESGTPYPLYLFPYNNFLIR